MNFTHTRCTFFMLLSFVLCLFMFALSLCCILFVMLSFHGALFLYHASYSLCFYHVLFSYCSFFFSCCGFHVTLFSFFHLSLLVDLFSCCTISIFHFFVLHFFHVNCLHRYFHTFLTLSLISWYAFFMWLFFHVVSLLQLFHAALFDVKLFSCCSFSVCCSCLKSIHFGLFHIVALFLCFHSFDVTVILGGTFS